jgi:hypothetical protein
MQEISAKIRLMYAMATNTVERDNKNRQRRRKAAVCAATCSRLRSKTHGAGYFGRVIVEADKSIDPTDCAYAEEQSKEKTHHERGGHFPKVAGVEVIHASAPTMPRASNLLSFD